MELPLPLLKNVVLVGGGHAHALLLRSWAMKPVAGARLTIINPTPTAPYTGMLPGFVAGHYTRDELDIDLVRLARFSGARLITGIATAIDRADRTVTVGSRPPIPYDICSINVGITSDLPDLPGFDEHAVAAKPLGRFAPRWSAFVETLDVETEPPAVVVIGGGIGGCELAMAMNHRLTGFGKPATVTIIDSGEILSDIGDSGRGQLRSELESQGIRVIERTEVTRIETDRVLTSHGQSIRSTFTVTASGARPFDWLNDIGLALTEGSIDVGPTLQTTTDPNIFAVGDCAHLTFDPRPKAGVFAVRQAPVLAKNIQALLRGTSLERYSPQRDYLKLISLGQKSAGADKFGRYQQGRNMWTLKDRIDRRFMEKLNDLPEMEGPKVPRRAVSGMAERIEQHPPLCGGCGAKVGLDVLAGPLGALPESTREDVVRLPGDDAALLKIGDQQQVITTDQLRSFTEDPFRMARIATLHALGDVWAMGGEPQAALVTITLPQLGRGLQEEWLGEIMAGTSLALSGTGCEVVGGHTSMGAELSIAYTVTGLVGDDVITLSGAQPDQAVVLTRALGSGVLFAAEMSGKANGNDVAALLDALEQPQGDASRILKRAGATAMTDVTGFGLAGHLLGILRSSEVGAALSLDDIPIFAGALQMSRRGVRSHLYESNMAAVPLIQRGNRAEARLLFDPQTAGGLLATVPRANADDALEELRRAGFGDSRVIGETTAEAGMLRVT